MLENIKILIEYLRDWMFQIKIECALLSMESISRWSIFNEDFLGVGGISLEFQILLLLLLLLLQLLHITIIFSTYQELKAVLCPIHQSIY